jgi:hypothetical protein
MSNIDFTVKVVASPGASVGNPEYKATVESASIDGTPVSTEDLKNAYDAVSKIPANTVGGSSSQSSRGGRSRKGKRPKGGKSRKARKSLRRK